MKKKTTTTKKWKSEVNVMVFAIKFCYILSSVNEGLAVVGVKV